ncbi:hypothetical protein Trisim1_012415 [Trichoderma cf. simile WF8]
MPELRQREIGAVAALLCTHCDNILDSLEGLQLGNMTPWMDVSYHVNICGIKEAAKSGCELCRVILAGFRTEHLQRLSAEPNTQLKARIGMFTSQDLSLVFQCCEATTSFRAKEKSSIRMAIHAQLPDEAEKIPSIPKSTGDVEALNLAKQWLEHCVQNHEACRPPESNDGPARIVSIGSNTSRLVPLSELPDRFEYATLSHCWGNIQYLKLLKDNLEEFQHQIPAHRLSKTFTDAIKITKHLGISYLWVDSLCIIQDDGDDWHRESKKMSTIYGCSTINIAATGAENGSIGCFFDRDSDLRDKLRKARIPERIVQEKVLITYDCIRDSICQDDIDIAPLASRGWCFQERFLPARALHFAKSQIWWKCQCYGACESFPDGIPLGLGLPNVKSRATKLFEKNHAQSLEAEHVMLSVSANTELGMLPDVHFWDQSKLETATSLAAAWEKAVEIYSGTRLTRSRDKLIAIAGVAEWFSGRNGDEYVAGFWRQYLETQLLWYTAETQHETCDYDTKATEYLAPSWSWASTRCRVKYKRAFDVQDYDDEEQTWTQNINVVNVSIELSDPSFLYGGTVWRHYTARILETVMRHQRVG